MSDWEHAWLRGPVASVLDDDDLDERAVCDERLDRPGAVELARDLDEQPSHAGSVALARIAVAVPHTLLIHREAQCGRATPSTRGGAGGRERPTRPQARMGHRRAVEARRSGRTRPGAVTGSPRSRSRVSSPASIAAVVDRESVPVAVNSGSDLPPRPTTRGDVDEREPTLSVGRCLARAVEATRATRTRVHRRVPARVSRTCVGTRAEASSRRGSGRQVTVAPPESARDSAPSAHDRAALEVHYHGFHANVWSFRRDAGDKRGIGPSAQLSPGPS